MKLRSGFRELKALVDATPLSHLPVLTGHNSTGMARVLDALAWMLRVMELETTADVRREVLQFSMATAQRKSRRTSLGDSVLTALAADLLASDEATSGTGLEAARRRSFRQAPAPASVINSADNGVQGEVAADLMDRLVDTLRYLLLFINLRQRSTRRPTVEPSYRPPMWAAVCGTERLAAPLVPRAPGVPGAAGRFGVGFHGHGFSLAA
ncbi:hypothetical protein ABT095_20880 [Kitasatospora sp. NPDC002227]|uniref:hypothetical protein n=1 Tax=Kitasatospora sp. NPDC002227 TaxID=3154773 RepID=UPI003330C59C